MSQTQTPWYQKTREQIEGVSGILIAFVMPLVELIDRGVLFRRAALVFVAVFMVKVALWIAGFAEAMLAKGLTGADISMVIGAVATPLSAFSAAVFKFYGDRRNKGERIPSAGEGD